MAISAEGYNRKGYKPPSKMKNKWQPGCKCSVCGKEIKEEQLSKIEFEKNYELKWGVHIACVNKVSGVLDRNTR